MEPAAGYYKLEECESGSAKRGTVGEGGLEEPNVDFGEEESLSSQ